MSSEVITVSNAGAVALSLDQVIAFRLQRHHLAERAPAKELVAVVRDVCGIQAQLGSAARMALWARVQGIAPDDVDRALWEERALAKTWCMRGTVHLIPAADVPVYVAALRQSTVAEEMRWMARYGLGSDKVQNMVACIAECLASGPLTRRDLADCVASSLGPEARKWIEHAWGGVVKQASLQGLVCFGPDRGQETTFVRQDRWLPGPPRQEDMATGDAGTLLMRGYLHGYGPATWQDFASWTGMPVKDTASIGRRLTDDLVEVSVEGRPGFLLREDLTAVQTAALGEPAVRLLPSFDPYLLGHGDRSHLVSDAHYKRVFRKAGWLSPVVLVNGRVAGVWSHERKGRKLMITVEPFGGLSSAACDRIGAEAEDIGRFLGLSALVKMTA